MNEKYDPVRENSGHAREVAAEYDNRENMVSKPPRDVPGAPAPAAAGGGPLLIWSSRLPAVGDMLAQSPEVVCAWPIALLPGENPPPSGVLLSMLEDDGDGMAGGGGRA